MRRSRLHRTGDELETASLIRQAEFTITSALHPSFSIVEEHSW